MTRFARVSLCLAFAWSFLAPSPARADAIDGAWCSQDGRRVAIEGSRGVVGKGTRIEGEYSRHHFRFTMPAPDPAAGLPVDMVLQGESATRVRIGTGEPQTWRRCPADIS